QARQDDSGFTERLRGECASVGGRAAVVVLLLDHGDALVEVGRGRSPLLPGRAGADDDQVKLFGCVHRAIAIIPLPESPPRWVTPRIGQLRRAPWLALLIVAGRVY